MEKPSPTYIQYSKAFQKKVVEEIRREKFTMEGARYDIGKRLDNFENVLPPPHQSQ